MHGDEARTETFDAGKVLIAVRLIDLPLAPEFGFERQYRDAIRGPRAIAATFAHGIVDDRAHRWIGEGAAFPTSPLFSRAGLVIDQRGQARQLAQLALNRIELAAVMEGH